MTLKVSDKASNKYENLQHVAEVLGRSKDRLKVFKAIFYHKRKIKTVDEIVRMTKLKRKRVLEEAHRLAQQEVVTKTKSNGKLAYERDEFIASNKRKVFSIAGNLKKIEEIPTRRSPTLTKVIKIAVSTTGGGSTTIITVDDIDSFDKVKNITAGQRVAPVQEVIIKEFLQVVLQERGQFKDWGGEGNDLFTSRMKFRGIRHTAAFALKGRGTKGKLVPKKMGKNGDQIQQLFSAPAELFLIVYWGQIQDSIVQQMEAFANLRASMTNRKVYYGIVDGQDLQRLFDAYPQALEKASFSVVAKKGGD